jgi:DNA-binding transcriptional LysR family regulator
MTAPLDLDQLQSFCAIADCGSFPEAARRLNKTQSAVSMQIKRLEERLGQSLLTRDGRRVTLTLPGETLYSRARKMLRTNAEILDHFSEGDLLGSIRFGVPDDYAVRLLPVILSSFQRTHPKIAVDVACMASEPLLEGMRAGRYDLIVLTQGTEQNYGDLFRTEKMFWVASHGGRALASTPLAVALRPHGLHLAQGCSGCAGTFGDGLSRRLHLLKRHRDIERRSVGPCHRVSAGKRATARYACRQ